MGRHQRAETSGLISFLICAVVGAVSMNLYMEYAPAIWQLTQRRFMVCSGIVAACGVISFIIGYARKSRSLNLKHGWFAPIRRIFEIVALSVVYASTIFLSSFALIGAANDMMGNAIFSGYISSVCAAFAGVVGYMTFVQAEMMNAKTIASLLPFFVISGVVTAGMTTDDPYWYHNNFSQLGDRTTFAARMFNSTLILAGTCIIILTQNAAHTSAVRSEATITALDRRGASHGRSTNSSSMTNGRPLAHILCKRLCGVYRNTPMPMNARPATISRKDRMEMRSMKCGIS